MGETERTVRLAVAATLDMETVAGLLSTTQIFKIPRKDMRCGDIAVLAVLAVTAEEVPGQESAVPAALVELAHIAHAA